MKHHQSEEDYLENILILSKENPNLHSIDIANYMSFSKPSVSIAIHKLKDKGLVNMESDGVISLTDKGLLIAEKTYEKHLVLSKMLISLGVSEETAHTDACEIEHCISDESFEKIKEHFNKKK